MYTSNAFQRYLIWLGCLLLIDIAFDLKRKLNNIFKHHNFQPKNPISKFQVFLLWTLKKSFFRKNTTFVFIKKSFTLRTRLNFWFDSFRKRSFFWTKLVYTRCNLFADSDFNKNVLAKIHEQCYCQYLKKFEFKFVRIDRKTMFWMLFCLVELIYFFCFLQTWIPVLSNRYLRTLFASMYFHLVASIWVLLWLHNSLNSSHSTFIRLVSDDFAKLILPSFKSYWNLFQTSRYVNMIRNFPIPFPIHNEKQKNKNPLPKPIQKLSKNIIYIHSILKIKICKKTLFS